MKSSVSRNYKKIVISGLVLAIIAISVGYAALSTSLKIDGSATAKSNSWNIHFDNLTLDDNNTVTGTQSITSDTSLSFTATLDEPGDYYGLIVDVVNEGTIDAMINTISKTTLTEEQSKYLNLQITYSDGTEISEKDKLVSSDKETILISLSYKDDIDASDLPDEDTSITINLDIEYIQVNNEKNENTSCSSFANDSWETIYSCVNSGSYNYQVGDEKEITVAAHKNTCSSSSGYGSSFACTSNETPEQQLTLRIVNTTECISGEVSHTACGFVVEFADIIDLYNFNDADETNIYATNVGGWPASKIRKYLEETIYYALPTDLQNAISLTKVVSSHGNNSGETNFTTYDRLYLLSTKEVWNGGTGYDTADDTTRQLDYYSNLGVTTSKHYGAIKYYNGMPENWWLRSAFYGSSEYFYRVSSDGDWYGDDNSYDTNGIAPAFRIGSAAY